MSKGSPCKSVLLVEDDAATRDALTVFLEGQGYTVRTAANGQEALIHLRQNPPPSVILLDLKMPVTDAHEFRRAQKQDPALSCIPVVVLSATSEFADRDDLLGDVGHVPKPVDADVLLAALQRFTTSAKPEILVVEDDKGVLQMLDMALRHYGFAVRLASSGHEAVEVYQRHRETITLVLMDVQMPDFDGPATLAVLNRINPAVRCCFMSGHTGKYTEKELLSMGAAHVLMKPFPSLSLLTRLLWDMAGEGRRAGQATTAS